MNYLEIVFYILICQGLLGAFDVLWNHEYKESLPSKDSAALEQQIHGVRELLYSVIFLGLAWFTWGGFWACVFFGIVVVEILLTAWDFLVEDQTRKLSPTERVVHLVMSMTGGAYVAFLILVLWDWFADESVLTFASYGAFSYILSLFGLGVLAWGVRDLIAGVKLARAAG